MRILSLLLFSFTVLFVQAQTEPCGDPQALNYNPLDPQQGYNCVYPATVLAPTTETEIADVPETSGIIAIDERIYSHNDSGGEPQLFVINPTDGTTEQIVRLQGLTRDSIRDWEALTQDEDFIYIGDFGNNNGTRKDLRVYRVHKNQLNPLLDTVWVNYDVIPFFYPEQSNFESNQSHNFDCEGFIAKDDTLWLFTKNRGDLNTSVYKIPAQPSETEYAAELLETYSSLGQITGATYYPERGIVALIGYINLARPFVYLLWDFPENNFFNGYVRRLELPDGATGQAEAICYFTDNTVFISNENLGVPARLSSFEDTYTQEAITSGILGKDWKQEIRIRNNRIELGSVPAGKFRLISVEGKTLHKGKYQAHSTVVLPQTKEGVYVLQMEPETGTVYRKKLFLRGSNL